MARDKIFDPAFQKAFTEAIFKEKKLKAKWHLEHGSTLNRVSDTCLWDDEPDDDEYVQPSTSTRLDKHPPKEPGNQEDQNAVHARELDTKQHTAEEEEEDEETEAARPLQIMKPVAIRTKKLLYKGLSHDEEGKEKYLRKRKNLDPEEKYHFPVCSSWEYGWTYGLDYALKCPDYGRREIIKTSFFRPNDPLLKPRRR